MKKLFLRMSRRERFSLLAGAAVLLAGAVVYPTMKAAAAYRRDGMEILEEEEDLLQSLQGLARQADAIKGENDALHAALKTADELLFPPVSNPVLMQASMTRLLNELGPDLDLQVSAGRSSIKDGSNRMNLVVRGRGRYPEILKFLYRLETNRPLILVDDLHFSASSKSKGKSPSGSSRSGGSGSGKGSQKGPQNGSERQGEQAEPQKGGEPSIGFQMDIQIHFQQSEEAS